MELDPTVCYQAVLSRDPRFDGRFFGGVVTTGTYCRPIHPVHPPKFEAAPGLRVPGAWDGFELAVRAVLGQQVTVAGATTLAGRLVKAFGTPLPTYENLSLTHLFPQPEALAEADLSSIGIIEARAGAIRALASAVACGQLKLDASQGLEEKISRLCAIPGIGDWTANYIAMRALGETDAFPADDLGLRRALANGKGLVSARELTKIADEWRPWRAYAAMCLWASLPNYTTKSNRRRLGHR